MTYFKKYIQRYNAKKLREAPARMFRRGFNYPRWYNIPYQNYREPYVAARTIQSIVRRVRDSRRARRVKGWNIIRKRRF